MPCESGPGLDDTTYRRLRETAACYAYALDELGQTVPATVTRAITDSHPHDYAPALCALLRSLTKTVREQLLYSQPKDRRCRDLASWWDDHRAEDRKRRREELAEIARLRKQAAQLTKLADQRERDLTPLDVDDARPRGKKR